METSKSAKLKLLHIVPRDGMGGVEIAAKSMLARYDLSCNFELLFISDTHVRLGRFRRLWHALADYYRAFQRARAFQPDVIICSLWRSVPLAIAIRMISRRSRLAFFVHNDKAMHPIDAAFARIAMWYADAVWGDSEAVLRARSAPERTARVISFVIDRLRGVTGGAARPTFVSWGRLNHQKGLDRAIRLIRHLTDRGLDVGYDIYGPDGGERQALERLVRDLKLDEQIRFLGPTDHANLSQIAATHQFFLQLSRSEGMCIAAVEAMQLGLIPIATAVGQMAHYVVPGETGVLVDPDQPSAAADEIEGLINDPAERRRRSKASLAYWKNAKLYADDVCAAAIELTQAGPDTSAARYKNGVSS